MKKIIKYLLIFLGLIVAAAGIFYFVAFLSVQSRLNKEYNVDLTMPYIKVDSAMLAKGEHLSLIKGCQDCHGRDLAGRVVVDDPAVGIFAGRNLTSGKGGLPSDYNDKDWIRAIRHGLNREKKPLKIMPSQELTFLTEEDLFAIIAYAKTRPAVDREVPKTKLRPMGILLTHFNKIPVITAEMIDHKRKPVEKIENQVSYENGEYLAISCSGCHQPNLKGGPAIIPGSPDPADIPSTGNLLQWSEDQFINTLRTGVTPEGKQLQNEFMPWQMTKEFSDVELKSLYLYLRSI